MTRADEIEDIASFESSLVIDLGGTTLDVASITGQLEQISKVKVLTVLVVLLFTMRSAGILNLRN